MYIWFRFNYICFKTGYTFVILASLQYIPYHIKNHVCSTRKLDLDSVDEREKVIRVSFDESNFNSIEIISRKQSMLALNAG